MPRRYPGSTPGVDPRGQGVIPRQFKRKKIFVTDGRTPNGWTDRRDSQNSDVDKIGLFGKKFQKWLQYEVSVAL